MLIYCVNAPLFHKDAMLFQLLISSTRLEFALKDPIKFNDLFKSNRKLASHIAYMFTMLSSSIHALNISRVILAFFCYACNHYYFEICVGDVSVEEKNQFFFFISFYTILFRGFRSLITEKPQPQRNFMLFLDLFVFQRT